MSGQVSASLTPRQTEILDLISRGFHYDAIASKLGIAQNTMWAHTKQMYSRLGVRDAAHAVRRGFELGVLSTGHRDIDELRVELARAYRALAVANDHPAPLRTVAAHPFGEYLLSLREVA